MESLYTVTLTGGGPWGIRIQGGKDFSTPLSIRLVLFKIRKTEVTLRDHLSAT